MTDKAIFYKIVIIDNSVQNIDGFECWKLLLRDLDTIVMIPYGLPKIDFFSIYLFLRICITSKLL